MIRLEPLAASHLESIEALITDPDVLRFTRVPVPPPPAFVDEYVKQELWEDTEIWSRLPSDTVSNPSLSSL